MLSLFSAVSLIFASNGGKFRGVIISIFLIKWLGALKKQNLSEVILNKSITFAKVLKSIEMAKKESVLTYDVVVRSIQERQFKPVYYLMGEESYYIDRIADYITNNVLTEEQKDFNFTTLYGAETDMNTVVMTARRYPMMSDYQVVLVKEAQNLKNLDPLAVYLQNPQPQTILVFCHKNGVLDRRKKVAAEIERVGFLFESKKLYERELPGFITSYVQRKGMTIDSKSVELLVDYVGSDLNRMAGEIDKLGIKGDRRITPDLIEQNIGVSKEYNTIELKNALIARDVLKSNRIVNYFDKNQKAYPIQMILPSLFTYFSNLMLAHYSPVKNEAGVMETLGLRQAWQARDYLSGMRVFSARKTMNIIAAIRETDARSKGFGNSMATSGELLRDLVYFILH